jgi:hypothetical protein
MLPKFRLLYYPLSNSPLCYRTVLSVTELSSLLPNCPPLIYPNFRSVTQLPLCYTSSLSAAQVPKRIPTVLAFTSFSVTQTTVWYPRYSFYRLFYYPTTLRVTKPLSVTRRFYRFPGFPLFYNSLFLTASFHLWYPAFSLSGPIFFSVNYIASLFVTNLSSNSLFLTKLSFPVCYPISHLECM